MRGRLAVLFAFVGASAVVAAGCTGLGVSRSTWAFAAVQISELSGAGYTGEGVTVAIVDTGIDLGHPNLKGVTLVLWVDLVNSMPDPYDDNGHGTAMASIMVGRGSLAGGAPGVSLIVIKAISGDGSGSDEIVATAINTAASHGADIISLSLGGSKPTLILGSASTQAVQSAASLGVLVVGSAGNDGENDDGQVASPGVANAAISVGAVDSHMQIAPFSSVGCNTVRCRGLSGGDPNKKPEVVAPGVDIAVAWLNGQAATVSGTSPAAVFVSAGLALLLEKEPQYKRAGSDGVNAVKTAILNSAKKLDGQASPHDSYYGYGLFQARSAADALP